MSSQTKILHIKVFPLKFSHHKFHITHKKIPYIIDATIFSPVQKSALKEKKFWIR